MAKQPLFERGEHLTSEINLATEIQLLGSDNSDGKNSCQPNQRAALLKTDMPSINAKQLRGVIRQQFKYAKLIILAQSLSLLQ